MKMKQIPTWPEMTRQLVIRDLFSLAPMLQLYTELPNTKVSLAQLGYCLRYVANESRVTCSYHAAKAFVSCRKILYDVTRLPRPHESVRLIDSLLEKQSAVLRH